MANERVESEFTVPSSTTLTATTVAISATAITVTAGATFPTDLCSDIQTQLNNNVQGYPTTAAAAAAAIGGTWTNGKGWLFNITSGNDTGAFGGTTMTASGSPSYGAAGPRSGVDKAVGFTTINDLFSAGDVLDPVAGDVLIGAVLKVSAHANGDVCGKGWGTSGFLITTGAAGSLTFWASDGVDSNSSTASSLPLDEYVAVLAVLDRSTERGRLAFQGLTTGTQSIGSEFNTTAIKPLDSAGNLTVGKSGAFSANTNLKVAGFFIVTGASVATGLSSGISAALTKFANAINAAWTCSLSSSTGLISIGWTGYSTPTWSLTWGDTTLRGLMGFTANISSVTTTQTGTEMPSGVWVPGCPLAADSDPLQAPKGDDKAASISPTGRVFSLASSTYFRHRNVRFSHVAQNRVWANSATTVGADWETFYLETQVGQHSWFDVGSRVRVFFDNAGTVTEVGSGDVDAWYMPSPTKMDDLRLAVAGWTGLVEINLGDLYTDA